jgi:Na+:H+ antiporter, NhaA family
MTDALSPVLRAPGAIVGRFLKLEAAGGILLVAATILAMVLANSAAAPLYDGFLNAPVSIQAGPLKIAKPLLLWINDGLMAIFFLLVGCEVKREIVAGELRRPSQAALPLAAAIGGMAVPALVYVLIAKSDPTALRGWAVPTATDIAFALGVLSLLGSRVPATLKLFLLTLAIIDDLGAIIIIAIFYTSELSSLSLGLAFLGIAGLVLLNRAGVTKVAPYMLVGLFIWVCVLKSGVHATLAGVAIGLSMPIGREGETSPLAQVEHGLHPWVAFGILPLFAFANAGVSLAGIGWAELTSPVALGTAAGLFLGKQIGVMTACFLAIRLGIARLPDGATWPQLYGVAILTSIGFTMSLFVGSLAFENAATMTEVRVGVLGASILAAAVGYGVMRLTTRGAAAAA